MTNFKKRRAIGIFAANLVLAMTVSTLASEIVYDFSGLLTGSLDEMVLEAVPFSISFQGDTNDVDEVLPGIYLSSLLPAKISIFGHGTGTFTPPPAIPFEPPEKDVFVNQNTSGVGISGVGFEFNDELIFGHSALATYNLTSALGPLDASLNYNDLQNKATSLGLLSATLVSNPTFTARLVPEPSQFATPWVLLSVVIVHRLSKCRRNRVAAAIADRGPHTTWHAGVLLQLKMENPASCV